MRAVSSCKLPFLSHLKGPCFFRVRVQCQSEAHMVHGIAVRNALLQAWEGC